MRLKKRGPLFLSVLSPPRAPSLLKNFGSAFVSFSFAPGLRCLLVNGFFFAMGSV
jgi:hypothetical protein